MVCCALPSSRLDGDEISFNRDVRPILSDRCFHCHGPDAENQDSEFRLDSRDHATADLGGYAGIVPGDLAGSEVHRRIHSSDHDRMPPADAVRQLTDKERAILDQWIQAGAPFDQHWAYVPLPEQTRVPSLSPPMQQWARNEIDAFIGQGIEQSGMQPNKQLGREKWLRRVTFDLTGLPPTPKAILAFRNDTSEQAYEKVVDQLLSSAACAERLTSEWLDVARYSDSYGYQRDDERFVWPYRDWVIRAFRDNMPFDQFITCQVAGDLLPNATVDQRLATTFNRLHSHKKEGGSSEEEFRIEMVSDRVHTFASAFLGMTMECARCHDHKYDPIRTKEYYQLASFFANIDERGLISFFTPSVPTPAMPLPSREQAAALEAAQTALDQAESDLEAAWTQSDPGWELWRDQVDTHPLAAEERLAPASAEEILDLPGLVSHLSFDVRDQDKLPDSVRADTPAKSSLANRLVPGHRGKSIQLTGDDAVTIPNVAHFARHDPFSFSLWINAHDLEARSVILRRSRAWDDAGSAGYELLREGDRLNFKICHFWPGNAIAVRATRPITTDRWYHVAVTYDGSSKASGLKLYIDGSNQDTEIWKDHLTRDASNWPGARDLAIGERFRDRGFKQGQIDEFSVFDRELSSREVARLAGIPLPSDEASLKQEYGLSTSPVIGAAQTRLHAARKTWNQIMDSIPAIMVMEESEQPRATYVLRRGSYEDRGEQVTPDTPDFLPDFPEDAPENRLGLAQWLTDPYHPLTARVAVNRYWQIMFGVGLVRTPEDFGLQGQPPTHPELLDWLARRFVESGWDIRKLLRMIALSSTYRQSSIVSAQTRVSDPENTVYARGPSQRLSAEMVRDNALAVSGLLVDTVGGPPSRPYDLALAYNPIQPDRGKGLYRRSLYTFWKRTSPAPAMITMNANKREVCRLRREVASSPLQALVLLNGTQFMEASRVLASRLLTEHPDDLRAIIHEAFLLFTSRKPSEQETQILEDLVRKQQKRFADQPARIQALLGDLATESATSSGQPGSDANAPSESGLPGDQLAAVTVLINTIMNFDESVRLE